MSEKSYVYDVETIINCFTVTFVRAHDRANISFEISERRNDVKLLIDFLDRQRPSLIGYNNLAFDSPVVEYIVQNHNRLHSLTGDKAAYEIYKEAQRIIDEGKKRRTSSIGLSELDLFLLHHFDNEAKFTSLKWIECHLRWPNIIDMPFPHDVPLKKEDIDKVHEYNLNDVNATLALANHNKTIELLEIRKWAAKEFGDNRLYNFSNSSLGEFILMSRLKTDARPSKRYDFTRDAPAINCADCGSPGSSKDKGEDYFRWNGVLLCIGRSSWRQTRYI
jgi:hypothetical protein